ncbi:MAG: HNH endonuclease [Beijerinckiaceae bacterium]|nr:HNH endonuclease [Beijerinckiaceae bacterium]
MARRVKKLHNNTCQICGNSLKLQGSKTYAEAHHVKPLGSPHYGPDVASNIITLCPTHHVLCDYGAIALDSAALRSVNGHAVSQHYIDYHNTVIVNSCR